MGYYTNATLLDYPGLTSERVTDAIAEHPEFKSPADLADHFHPDWLVLRPSELEQLQGLYPETASEYQPVKEFSVTDAETPLDRWGLTIFNLDRDFIVLRRTTPAAG